MCKPHPDLSRRGLAQLVLVASWLSTGCGAGTVAILAGSSDSSGGGNSAPSIANLQVPVFKTSPARIRFELSDLEGESVRVKLYARVPMSGGGLSEPQVLTRVSGPDFPANDSFITIPAGNQVVAIDADWFFPEESFPQWPDDGRYVPNLQLIARLSTGTEFVLGDDEPLSIGNDPPQVTNVTPVVPVEQSEVSGIARIQVTVEDSSDDVVSVLAEYDVVGDDPDESWQPATGFGLSDVRVSRAGTTLSFFWETDTDLEDLERQVKLRFTATDDAPASGDPVESAEFRVDNNATPIVQLDSGLLVLNPDERRGLPIPFRVLDEEDDLVDVIFQWRREGEQFPELPTTDAAALDAILADPLLRQEKHICTPLPLFAHGRVVPIDANTVRLPELASSEAWILAAGLEGGTLELLRPSSIPSPLTPTWSSNPLVSPIAALSVGDGLTALVLDVPGNGRLREIELATGAIVREIATLGPGIPSAMAFERGETAVLVALDDAGTWRIERVELSSGALTGLIVSDGSEPAPVRGIASLGTTALVFTAGSSLFHLDYRDLLAPQLGNLLTDLTAPWGVVVDPLPPERIYVSERDANRVLAIELDSHGKLPTVVKTADLQPGILVAPEALALERLGARMLVVTSSPGGGRQLVGLDLGATGGNRSLPIGARVTTDVASVATGSDELRLQCLPSSNELLAAGGIEQRRVIAAHSTSSQDVSVELPFGPVPSPGQPWRLAEKTQQLQRASAQEGARRFVWDSADAISGLISLRAEVRDTEFGLAADGAAPKRVRAALEVEALPLGGPTVTSRPSSVAAGDLDGDGDLDLVSANRDGNNLRVFFQDSGSFTLDPRPPLGGPGVTDAPVAVAAADLDGDGDQDLVSANSVGDNLRVFFQDSGTFTLDPGPPLGGSGVTNAPVSVAAGDLDGDGDLDLVSANRDGNNLRVFFQDSGTFTLDPGPPLGGPGVTSGPVSVAGADLDGDGDLDLVSANSVGDNLTVFFQDSGTFTLDPEPPLGGPGVTNGPVSVAAADLDGDGDLDLVSANNDGNTLTVFFQNSGSFAGGASLSLGSEATTNTPRSVAAADLDGDGDLDLVSANFNSDNLEIFFQLSPRIFGSTPLALGGQATTFSATSVAAADLDGDGDLDLVSANAESSGDDTNGQNLTVFFQLSPGSFPITPSLTVGASTFRNQPVSVAVADLDGDGDLDLAAANSEADTLTISFQLLPGSFAVTPLTLGGSATTNQPSSVAAADLDGDGHLDLVSANKLSNNLRVFFQDSGSFGTTPPLPLGGLGRTRGPLWVTAADLDGDGDQDLVSANSVGDNLTVFFQDSGSFQAAPSLTLGGPTVTSQPSSVAAGDLDGDGDLDLVSANRDGNNLTVFFQDSGSFTLDPRPPLGGPGVTDAPVAVAAADLDGDGDQDLVSANRDGNNLTVFFQDSGSFTLDLPLTLGDSGVTDAPVAVAAADLDGDGDLDLISANELGLNLTVFLQLSPRSFGRTPLSLSSGGAPPASVAAGDLDGDGDLDLVLANKGDFGVIRGDLKIFFGGH